MAANRDVTNYQWRVVCNALAECSLPIFVKLVFAETCRWKSYSKPNDTVLASNVMDSIFKLFERIEIQVTVQKVWAHKNKVLLTFFLM